MTTTLAKFEVPISWSGRWPCSNLAGLTVEAEYAENGDLVDLRLFDGEELLSETDERVQSLEAAELESAQEVAERSQCPRCESLWTHETGHVTHEGAVESYCDNCEQHFKTFGDIGEEPES